ncbi:MAG TPA: hypothetical protein VK206_07610, partial [Anaerolineales bacterium]|nr:hypothetical protein [Anaerolineales bacterium]
TNNVLSKYFYDSILYIQMAERGLAPELRRSPFIYRFAGPLLAGGLHNLTGLSIYKSFKVLVYLGAISELSGVFVLVRHLTKSEKSAYVGMLSVAFSLYNLKYPLFDVYRPDILAYPIILIGTRLAFHDYFFPLLLTTMPGLQFREFTIVPLLAYLAAQFQHKGSQAAIRNVVISTIGLGIAVILPRYLIPASAHEEQVQLLSPEGIGQALSLLSFWSRDINIVYIVAAYFLPLLILYRRSAFRILLEEIPKGWLSYLAYYSGLVLLLVILGGSDLGRFASYFFVPLAVLVGLQVKNLSLPKILLILTIQIIFNRIWLAFPNWDFDLMINFYAGWATTFNTVSLWRWAELIALVALGNFLVHVQFSSKQKPVSESGES